MMGIKKLSIADIQTGDFLYYDPDLKDQCYKFCAARDIDCLPALDNSRQIYVRNDELKGFETENVSEDRLVDGEIGIFDLQLLEKFRERPLLLVYGAHDLTGVVHFCDYNKPVVSLYLYELFFAYEKALRSLLIQAGKTNDDMISFFELQKAKKRKAEDIKHYDEKITDYRTKGSKKKIPSFEVFYFSDLLALVNHLKIIKLSNPGELRNMVMHAGEFVHVQDPLTDDFIYNFRSFEVFFTLALQLHQDFKRVTNRLAFIQ
jgi:hypothetical protein